MQSIAARKRLLNHSQLTKILHEHPVQLVLHGHGHRTSIETIISNQDTEIPVIGAASSSSIDQIAERKAEFILFDVLRASQSWNIHMRNFNLQLQQNKFVESKFTDL